MGPLVTTLRRRVNGRERWYAVSIAPALLTPHWLLTCAWGGIGRARVRTRITWHDDEQAARAAMDGVLQAKRRKGYLDLRDIRQCCS